MAALIVPAPLSGQSQAEPPEEFQRVWIVLTGGSEKVQVALRFEPDRLVIRGPDNPQEFPYAEVDLAEYSYSKHRRWKETVGAVILVGIATGGIGGAVTGIAGFFLREKKHWLTLQTEDISARLRLDKGNYKAILEALRTHLGEQKVKTLLETKESLLEPLPPSRELAGAIGREFAPPVDPMKPWKLAASKFTGGKSKMLASWGVGDSSSLVDPFMLL